MSAHAEAFGRDRWRIYKCEERLPVVNLGGTAVGTGLAAPRQFAFQVTEHLRGITGLAWLGRKTSSKRHRTHVFVEVSGILKACASNLLKVSGDLRLLFGPDAGIGELRLPPRQAGSSIMPGKVNPVIPEAVSQAAMAVMAHDQSITFAASLGNLELNAFLPSLPILSWEVLICSQCLFHSSAGFALPGWKPMRPMSQKRRWRDGISYRAHRYDRISGCAGNCCRSDGCRDRIRSHCT
jgi:aspartate ammonia-lyase